MTGEKKNCFDTKSDRRRYKQNTAQEMSSLMWFFKAVGKKALHFRDWNKINGI